MGKMKDGRREEKDCLVDKADSSTTLRSGRNDKKRSD